MHFYTDIHLQGTAAILNSSGTNILSLKQDTLVSGTNIKTVNGSSILGSGNITIASGGTWGSITGTVSSQTDLQSCFNSKQNSLVSGTNIKTINGQSIIGSGDFVISSTGVTTGALSDKSITCISLGKSTIPTGVYTHCATSYVFSSPTYSNYVSGATCITGLTTLYGSVNFGSFNYRLGKANNTNPGYDSKCLLTAGEYYYSVKGKEELECSNTYLLAFKIKVISNVLTLCLLKAQTQLTTMIDSYSSLDPCLFFNYAVACNQFFTPTSNDAINSLNVSYCSTTIGVNPSFAIDDTCFVINGITDGQSLKYSASSKALTPYTPLSGVSTGLTNVSGTVSIDSACNTKWNNKQDSLISGTNVKTVNGNSIIGSGNIAIVASLSLDEISNVVVCPEGPVGSGMLIRCLGAVNCWEESSDFYRNTNGYFINIPNKTLCNVNSYTENTSCYRIANSITNAYGQYCNVVFSASTNNSSSAELRICNTAVMTGSSSGTIQIHDILCSSYLVNKLSISNTNLVTDTSCKTINNTNTRCICATVASSVQIFDNETYNYDLNGKYRINRTYNTCCGCVYINQMLNSSTATNCMFVQISQSATPTSNGYGYESCVKNNVRNSYCVKLHNNTNSNCCNQITFDAGTGSAFTTNSDYVNMFANCKYSLTSPTVDLSSALVACPGFTSLRYDSVNYLCISNTGCSISSPVFDIVKNTGNVACVAFGCNILLSENCIKLRGLCNNTSTFTTYLFDSRIDISSSIGGITTCSGTITTMNSNCCIVLNSYNCCSVGTGASVNVGYGVIVASVNNFICNTSKYVCTIGTCGVVISNYNDVMGYTDILGGCCMTIGGTTCYITMKATSNITLDSKLVVSSICAVDNTSCLSTPVSTNHVYKIANMLLIGNGNSITDNCAGLYTPTNNSIMMYNCTTGNFVPRTPAYALCCLGLQNSCTIYNNNTGLGYSCINTVGLGSISLKAYKNDAGNTTDTSHTEVSSFSVYSCALTEVTATAAYGSSCLFLYNTTATTVTGATAYTCEKTAGRLAHAYELVDGYECATKTISLANSSATRNNFSICGLPTTVSPTACSLWVDSSGFVRIGTCAISAGLSVSVCNVVYTSTANQTMFSLPLSTPSMVQVHLNGLKLPSSCYTLNTNNITFSTGILVDDIVDIDMIKIG